MAPLSLKIVKDDGAVTRKVKLDPEMKVWEVHQVIKEKFLMPDDTKDYGLFLRSPDNDLAGIWLEEQRTLSYYMLRNEDRLDYMRKIRNLRLRMLDGTVKTLQVDQSKTVSDLMISICGKIGLTNHDEYGLCFDSDDESEEGKENKGGSSGTLTLKKKSQLKERDYQFEQLSKKLKTDDNVEWIDGHKSLSEACVDPGRTLLLKRRLFYSDRNVDSRDPVQLNLLYVQARDNILQAVHPVTEATAVEFAGIQCQIHFGDFQEDKHKPGFLENLNEYLPEQFVNSWGIEKKILKEYRKHAGLSPLEAKYLYTKTARALPTYGVTFFLVKEKQKDKKKLVPRLLGINAESVLRLDEVTKEILQQWPLTHVKTYHAGKGETFTLNFGDYSDKEYSVKTRDAYRIRDILEGYIDLIRKRMLSAYSGAGTDHGTVTEENYAASQASIIQQVSNNQNKIIEHCVVGPSRIVPYEPGKEASHGTQIVTVQQIITTDRSGNPQKAVGGGIPLRSDMSMSVTRRLNRLNSSSVRVVSVLTKGEGEGPVLESAAKDARDVVRLMEEDLAIVRDGVKETIGLQSSDKEKKKLEDQLRELEELMKALSCYTQADTFDLEKSVDTAKNIADLTTQMYFAMDPGSKRQSKLIESYRPSFIADERTESNLRRASFIAATATAMHTLDEAKHDLAQKYDGPRLSPDEIAETERSAINNLAKLNGAIAHYLNAHSDPKNVDYSAAVTSMNTIHEYMPELVKDAQALGSVMDEEARLQMLEHLKSLCDATSSVCSTVGSEDPHKIHQASKNYTDLSGKLVFVFGRGSKTNAKKKDEIMNLAKQVEEQADKLTHITEDVGKEDSSVKEAGDQLRTCARRLVDQAELTSPTIFEPHCQSSLTASCEGVSSSAQVLVTRSKPLLNDTAQDALHQHTLALAAALDRLKASYSDETQDLCPKETQKLNFKTTVIQAKKHFDKAQNQLQKEGPSSLSSSDVEVSRRRLADRLAQLNAAVAGLLSATSDRENPDYATADTAVATISELMPLIVQDYQISSANQDDASRAAMLEHIKSLCEATSALCNTDLSDRNANEDIAKFADASGQLVYIVSRRVNPEREQQIIELAAGACGMTSELLCSVQQLEQTAGDKSEELDARGAALADAAQNLLTQAQLTAASISDARCQSALLSAVDKTSNAGRQLAHSWAPLQLDDMHAARVQQLDKAMIELEEQLEKLRKACQIEDKEPPIEETSKQSPQEQKLKFIKSNGIVQDQLKRAIDDLDKPLLEPVGIDPVTSERLLAHRLGLLSAALSQLLQATRDVENPDYHKAEQSVKTISEIMPQVVQDVKSSSINKDAAARAAMLEHIKSLCEATSALCQYTDGTHPQDISDAISKYSEATDKLVFVITPHKKHNVGQQIVELSSASCTKASELLMGVQQLLEQVPSEKGEELDSKGAELAEAAQVLFQQAQLTSSSITEPQCRAAILSSVDAVSHAGQQLAHSWAPLHKDKQHKEKVLQLDKALKELEEQLERLRKACLTAEGAQSVSVQPVPPAKPARPTKPEKPAKPVKPGKPEIPKRVSSYGGHKPTDFTKEFLDRIRIEESQAHSAAAVEREKQLKKEKLIKEQQQFMKTVDDVNNKILNNEDDLLKWRKSSAIRSSSAMSASECLRLQEDMRRHLATAGVKVADIVAANYADKIDYSSASQSISALPKLVEDIVQEGKILCGTMSESARAALCDDMSLLCLATQHLCQAANTDRKELNDAAMEFGDKSAKLVYVVSTDADPTVEKEIISRAKAIGDGASRLALGASERGASAAVCVHATDALNAAGVLLYTAKLVSPCIHEVTCQKALVSSAENLSQTLATFSECCSKENPEDLKHLKNEADNLDRIVSTLISDVKGGHVGTSRETAPLVIEDTPLRLLTIRIIDDVKQLSQTSELPVTSRQEYASYADRLSAALRALDFATANCKRSPRDISKRSELEHAVQNLQMTMLTSRPHTTHRNSNIVDLRDFIEELSSEAQKLAEVSGDIKLEGPDKKALQDINTKCTKLSEDAYKLVHPDGETGYDTTFVDILDVDKFGQDCDELISKIESDLKSIQDARAKRKLMDKLIQLNETCNVLRFATKSGISSTNSAGLFSTLEDLDDIETRVIRKLVKEKDDQGHVTLRSPDETVRGRGRGSPVTSLVCAARDVTLTSPRAPLTAYIAHTAATVGNDTVRNKLLKHLYKLVSLYRLKALTTSKRLATWQNIDHPEVASITEQILQEIETPESGFSVQDKSEILKASDISKLLIPGESKILSNRKEQDLQLSKLCTKLSSMTNSVKQSIVSSQSLARSARETAKTACELAAVARGCKDIRDPAQCIQIEEDVQQMTFATYNLLKVAEQSTKDPKSHNTRRRLQDACRNLNNALSKLVNSSSSAADTARSCQSLSLSLQSLSPATGQYSPPSLWLDKSTDPSTDLSADMSEELSMPSAHTMSYENATEALQKQQVVLNKLNNDERRCRLEVKKELHDVTTAVRKSTEYATQCTYLMAISDSYKEVATTGVVDVPRIERGIERLQDSCMALIGAVDIQRAKEESAELSQRLSDLSLALEEASLTAPGEGRSTLARVRGNVANQGEAVHRALKEGKDMDKVLAEAVQLLEVLNFAYSTVDKCPLLPLPSDDMSADTKTRCDQIVEHSKSLVDKTLALVKDVESQEQTETMTWTTFSTSRKKLLEAYDSLLKTIRVNGQRAGILQAPVEEEKEDSDVQQKTYLETQVDLANKWLYRPMCKESVRMAGHQAVSNISQIARTMAEELASADREELCQLLLEVEELQLQCSTSRDVDKYRMLAERIKELKKCIQRGLVTRVVEDLVDVENPMEDLEVLADAERDPQKRKFILERKIAELLSQLGRVGRTARLVASAGGVQTGQTGQAGPASQTEDNDLLKSTKQAELLAPMLVQAAEKRINNPGDEEAIEKYKALVLEYAASIARVRELCDKSVDPMEFVQTAGDMMQRLRADSSSSDPQRSASASQAIIRLANRTIEVSLSSSGSQSDPELQAALETAKARLNAAAPRGTRMSRIPDIQASTDEIIKTTNEVESYLGGENIFNKQPVESNQQIFDGARTLHESVREWSSRDNEVVGAARRMAVLMARLSEYMHTDNKQALIATSKKIVLEAQEVAELAKKLAHECTDIRIKTNLLQTCERIPTISGQLKMLTTVKASSLGQQGSEEDKAAMDMLVGNAQSLMLSVQEVVKAAASASVKIMSQRGPRIKWVRKNYY